MATLALSVAGQFVGGILGGPFGATIGRAVGALAGSAVDGLLFGEKASGTTPSDVRLQGASEGLAVPRIYGWNRLSGNIIWARELELLESDGAGAKGFGSGDSDSDEVDASFAVAFCEGEVQRLGRIWADGQLLDPEGLTLRFYRGTETQLPDGLIESTQAAGSAPAYRGLCYMVFELLPLSRFGNRIPQISVELCRMVGELEPAIKAITVIPAVTEFGYDPVPRVRILGQGQTQGENTHMAASASDWSLSLDELQALCPNLERVSLVVAWFGDDLRCGHCQLGPRVENANRVIDGTSWHVAGLGRADVPVISTHDGGPAYGGTPSDNAVLAAIADLKARGLAVTLYPLVLMDIPAGNGLADPYGGSGGQAAYPWRGRITCSPAPGQLGSPDMTSGVLAQVSHLVTSYRAMVLHYAELAVAAGGVEALLLGSEMVGMSTLRGAANAFPFVDALVTLAADVRGIVGSGTKLSYGADWSEYSGYQAAGEKFFHLDPLWASADIDAVAIDNYFPTADWRDGLDHADATAAGPYDVEYLAANIAGGEGYDWFYASDADRFAGVRTPITDGAYGEPFVWRFKDIRNWWSHAHHDRPGGVRAASATAWVPGSKPIWFSELGCGAVDKGANQPNVFVDPKSAESGLPHFSDGTPDGLAQREFLRAQLRFWADGANNPAGMVDTDHIYLWTWDARPFPAFPQRTDVWADGPNHITGHWLTGRLGAVASDELALAIAADYGVDLGAVAANGPLIEGYRIAGPTSCREALAPVLTATGLQIRDDGALALAQAARLPVAALDQQELAATDRPLISRRRSDPGATTGRLALSYSDRLRDYQTATVTALRDPDGALAADGSGLVLSVAAARSAAERMLTDLAPGLETLDLSLPISAASLEIGDVVGVAGLDGAPFQIVELRDGPVRRISARSLPNAAPLTTQADAPRSGGGADFGKSMPVVALAHLPALGADRRTRLVAAAWAQPWPGTVTLCEETAGTMLAQLPRRGAIGTLTAALGPGPLGVWDHANVIELSLQAGHPAAADPLAVLAGSNRVAVAMDGGDWEIIGFAEAELIGPGSYRLRGLLRGQQGTGFAVGSASIGKQAMLIDARVVERVVAPQWLGGTLALRSYAGPSDIEGTALDVTLGLGPALPLAPVHLRATRLSNGDIAFSWVRCSGTDDDGWAGVDAPLDLVPERYAVSIIMGLGTVRTIDRAVPAAMYLAAEQSADFGGPPSSFDFTVAQVSPVYGPGHAASGAFHG